MDAAEGSKKRRAKRGEAAPAADRHLSGKMVRIEDDVHAALQRLAADNDRPLTRELRRAVIAWLEAAGKWPPPGTST
jgi:hypothetical protein